MWFSQIQTYLFCNDVFTWFLCHLQNIDFVTPCCSIYYKCISSNTLRICFILVSVSQTVVIARTSENGVDWKRGLMQFYWTSVNHFTIMSRSSWPPILTKILDCSTNGSSDLWDLMILILLQPIITTLRGYEVTRHIYIYIYIIL